MQKYLGEKVKGVTCIGKAEEKSSRFITSIKEDERKFEEEMMEPKPMT